jgi:pimeloyl-ACP methyl ester carboxylesterase
MKSALHSVLPCLFAVLYMCHFVGAAEKFPAGAASIPFVDQLGNADKPLTLWTYAPRRLNDRSPIVIVLHGVRRNGQQYRDQWVEHAEKRNLLLIVPEFPESSYSNEAYQRGNMFDEAGRPVDQAQWTFTAIEHAFDYVKQLAGNTSDKYFLYGHSAGGQVVQRLVLFLPNARYKRAIAANPGYYTMPDGAPFPYGLQGTVANDDTLKGSFGHDFVLLLGERDTERDDPNLRKTPEADAQGLTRFERGQNYFEMCGEKARALTATFSWRKRTVPGAGHSDKQMSKAAVAILFSH